MQVTFTAPSTQEISSDFVTLQVLSPTYQHWSI
jgi:hypothetical protein